MSLGNFSELALHAVCNVRVSGGNVRPDCGGPCWAVLGGESREEILVVTGWPRLTTPDSAGESSGHHPDLIISEVAISNISTRSQSRLSALFAVLF